MDLKDFALAVIKEGMPQGGLSGAQLEALALQHGVIVQHDFDAAKDGYPAGWDWEWENGDLCYKLTDELVSDNEEAAKLRFAPPQFLRQP